MRLSAIDTLWPEHLIRIAPALEELGYHRLWFTEHHGTAFQSANPALMCALIGHRLRTMRIGSAAVLLSYYSPMAVVEAFRLLEMFFPGRVDLGVSSGRIQEPYHFYLADERANVDYPSKLDELVGLWRSLFGDIGGVQPGSIGPVTGRASPFWVCGMSPASARRAGELGLCFAYHHTLGGGKDGSALIREYVSAFQPNRFLEKPTFNVACFGACAVTDANAERMVEACKRRVEEESGILYGAREGLIVGSEQSVGRELRKIAAMYETEEIVFQSFGPDIDSRIDSYARLKRIFRS